MSDEARFWTAVTTGDRATVESLVLASPRLATARRDGVSAILLAMYHHKPDVAACLRPHAGPLDIFEHRAKVDAASSNGMHVMPLHSAAAARSVPVARLLLEHGAPVDARQGHGSLGFTPLMEAAFNGQVDMVEALLAHGADPGLQDDHSQTAADHVRAQGHAALAERLGSAAWS